jgi:Amt family ammonium transporter
MAEDFTFHCSVGWSIAVAAWVLITTFILFNVVKKTVGLRVSHEEEIAGLDIEEHNTQAYNDFVIRT